MPEIWSIAITREGLGACALGLDMSRRDYMARWPMMRTDRIWSLDIQAMHWILAEALAALNQDLPDGELPLALALCATDRETACFVDADAKPLTPIYLDAPPVMPRREIPERYADAPEAATAYRNSVLRCIQQLRPEFCINEPPGIATIGGMVAHALTGHLADSCIPRGVSSNYPDLDADIFSAAGIRADWSVQRVRCGMPFARISPDIAINLGATALPQLAKLASIPVFHMGASDSARAYACAADPLSWSVTVGNELRAHWTAGINVISGYDIQIVDHREDEEEEDDGNTDDIADIMESEDSDDDNHDIDQADDIDNEDGDNIPQAPDDDAEENAQDTSKTRDDWTRLINESLALKTWPGPGKNLCGYGIVSAPLHSPVISQMVSACSPNDGVVPFEQLSSVPLGSGGLHVFPEDSDVRIIGLTSAHEPHHIVRAMFEGLMYTLRDWRNALDQPGPVRLILDKPWPPETAQWAADILNLPVFWIDDSKESLAAMGAALTLIRDLDLPVTDKPKLSANIIEPQPRSAAYQAHYQVHCALKQE